MLSASAVFGVRRHRRLAPPLFAVALAMGVGACSSSPGGSAPIVAPSSAAPSTLEPSNPPSDARDVSRPASVHLRTSHGSTLSLATTHNGPADLFVTPSGDISLQLSASDTRGDLFNLSGAATTGSPVTDDRVSAFVLQPGLYFDTTNPGQARCSTTFITVSRRKVSGTTTCTDLADGAGQQVIATFTIG